MRSWLNEARRHAAEIHDIMQLAAGATAFAAVLVFVTLSGRSQDDPVVRWMAEVGATMVAAEIVIPATADEAGLGTADGTSMAKSAAQREALTYEPSSTWTARRSNTSTASLKY